MDSFSSPSTYEETVKPIVLWGTTRDQTTNELDCDIGVKELKLHFHHYVYFRINILVQNDGIISKIKI